MVGMEAGTEDSRVTLTVFKCQECYVYSIPPASSTGHRADMWDVNKWLAEVDCAVITADEDAYIRLYDRKEGVAEGTALLLPRRLCSMERRRDCMQVVEPVTDSSRYFVLRVEDADSRRHAFLGFGFRDRAQASDFNAALHEHAQHLRRKQEALAMRAAFESSQGQDTDGSIEGAGGRRFQTDFSLKDGETLTLKLANTKLADRPGSFSMKGAKLANPIDLFGASSQRQGTSDVPALAPPASVASTPASSASPEDGSEAGTQQPAPINHVSSKQEGSSSQQQTASPPTDEGRELIEPDEWGDFKAS